jgi:nucleotide-binding universal stress UspA family protein
MKSVARILVATDFSDDSSNALAWGEELARRFEAELVVLHVEEPLDRIPGHELGGERHRVAEDELSRLVGRLAERGFRARGVLRTGSPFEQIVHTATTEPADMIVLGTHGRTGLSHLLMGSVAERVVRSAHCPVLTVRYAG